jgi:hypothetical protein
MALFDPKARRLLNCRDPRKRKLHASIAILTKSVDFITGSTGIPRQYVSKDINSRCDAITALLTDIEGNKLKILFEKGLKLCSHCKKEESSRARFLFGLRSEVPRRIG